MPLEHQEVIVIGAGIIGLATARALAETTGNPPLVIDAEPRIAAHQTGHNSGVIHAGLYYKPGSLKARLCAAGREDMYRYCAERSIPHERCGKVVVATRPDELPRLDELERRGRANGLTSLRRITPDELREHEPHATAIAALHVAETGITDFAHVARAMAEDVEQYGGAVVLDRRVNAIECRGETAIVHTDDGDLTTKLVINCGGLHCDRLARSAGAEPDVHIVPFRGEYDMLTDEGSKLVRGNIYPVPDPRFPFLGVHLTRMLDGRVKTGPNAVLGFARHGYRRTDVSLRDLVEIAGFSGWWRLAAKQWRTGASEFARSLSRAATVRALQRLVPEIRREHLRHGPSGVRAQAVDAAGTLVDDFRIIRHGPSVHVLNAPSPAATASLAIGRHIARLATDARASAAHLVDAPTPP